MRKSDTGWSKILPLVRQPGAGLFGGEGLVLATLTGPGTVWLQSLPFSHMADRIISAGRKGGKGKEEGSILGNMGIGNIFSNDH